MSDTTKCRCGHNGEDRRVLILTVQKYYQDTIRLVVTCQVLGHDSPEAELVREELDTTWYKLDQDAKRLITKYLEDLTKYLENL